MRRAEQLLQAEQAAPVPRRQEQVRQQTERRLPEHRRQHAVHRIWVEAQQPIQELVRHQTERQHVVLRMWVEVQQPIQELVRQRLTRVYLPIEVLQPPDKAT